MKISDFVKLFKDSYNGTQETIENGLLRLKENGASQIDSIKVLMEILDIKLNEADNIVLNSVTWSNEKNITHNIRDSFNDYLNENTPPV